MSSSSLVWVPVWTELDIVRVIAMVLITPLFVSIMWQFHKQNGKAWLKQAMFLWYTLVPPVTIAQILLSVYVNGFSYYGTCIYNLAGQLIILTGIVDSLQMMHVIKNLVQLTMCNMQYLLYLVVAYVLALVEFVVIVGTNSDYTVMRVITMTLIVTECGLNAFLLHKIKSKSSTTFTYYMCNFANRFGVIIGLIMAIGGVSKTPVSIVHLTATAFVIIMMYRIRANMKIKEGILAKSRMSKASESSTGAASRTEKAAASSNQVAPAPAPVQEDPAAVQEDAEKEPLQAVVP